MLHAPKVYVLRQRHEVFQAEPAFES